MTIQREDTAPAQCRPGGGSQSALTVRDLTIAVGDRGRTVNLVDDVSFDIASGSVLAVVGESGSGKTMTSLAVMGLLPRGCRVVSGSIQVDGREVVGMKPRALRNVRGKSVAMVFQQPMSSLNPAFTVGDQVGETARRHLQLSRRDAAKRAVEMLDLVGVPNAAQRLRVYPYQLSGGMRQRVAIAMALMCRPSVLIADEPTTALDATIQAQIIDLLRGLVAELGMALLLITHDLGVVAEIADQVAVMYAGQVVERAAAEEIFYSPKHPYTAALLRATPKIGGELHADTMLRGAPPSPGQIATGCRFRTRCDAAEAQCAERGADSLVGESRVTRCRRVNELVLRGVE